MSTDEREIMAPFHAYRFRVDFLQHSLGPDAPAVEAVKLCSGSFSECTGLEATMEPKAIQEGGRNYGMAQRVGKVTFATLVLKRGMTSTRDLWKWWELVSMGAYAYRLTAKLTVLGPSIAPTSRNRPAPGGEQIQWRWQLLRCLPVKFKAPDLNARSGDVAIEELHLAHEGLRLLDGGDGSAAVPA